MSNFIRFRLTKSNALFGFRFSSTLWLYYITTSCTFSSYCCRKLGLF